MSPWTADKDFAVGCSLWLPRKLYQLPPCSSGCRQTASLAQAHLDSLQQGTPLRPGKWMKFPIFLVSPNLPVCFTGCVKKTPDMWSERVMWLQLLSCHLEAFCHLQMIKKNKKQCLSPPNVTFYSVTSISSAATSLLGFVNTPCSPLHRGHSSFRVNPRNCYSAQWFPVRTDCVTAYCLLWCSCHRLLHVVTFLSTRWNREDVYLTYGVSCLLSASVDS